MTLTKADLVEKVYTTLDMSSTQAKNAVETFLKIAKDQLVNGEDVLLSGFGKFSVKDKKARKGRNPQTGVELILEARRVITFKPSGQLRSRCNHIHADQLVQAVLKEKFLHKTPISEATYA